MKLFCIHELTLLEFMKDHSLEGEIHYSYRHDIYSIDITPAQYTYFVLKYNPHFLCSNNLRLFYSTRLAKKAETVMGFAKSTGLYTTKLK